MTRRFLPAILSLLVLTTLSACKGSGAPSAHQNLSSVDPVRSAFNADSGKVRAIFLASPT
jgi:hypothetical protein